MTSNRLYHVTLTAEERASLLAFLSKGHANSRKYTRARILLLAHDTEASDDEIASLLHLSKATVQRTRKKYVHEGVDGALTEKRRPGACVKLTPAQERQVSLLACSDAPEGRTRWTLVMLADKRVELGWVETISQETVRKALKKTTPSPGCTTPTS